MMLQRVGCLMFWLLLSVTGGCVQTTSVQVESAKAVTVHAESQQADSVQAQVKQAKPVNVILMITDGASMGTWDMASLYEHGQTLSPEIAYFNFPVKVLMSTVPLNTSEKPTGGHEPKVVYDPELAWDTTPVEGMRGNYPRLFKGYEYLRRNPTDSAAAGTALASGRKTYNRGLNWDNDPAEVGSPMHQTIWQNAKARGMAIGSISNVPFSHATPAAFGAFNIHRNNYHDIARQMIESGQLDVVMGAGHPLYGHEGQVREKPAENFMTVAQYESLANGLAGAGTWRFIETHDDFQALAQGQLDMQGKKRLFGLARVAASLQQNREGYDPKHKVGESPKVQGVPDLPTMSRGALRVLHEQSHGKGFFLMIEGGAVDWAAHANQTGRIIEEQMDFNHAVNAVVQWVETIGGGWSQNLLIVTTDHGNGMPMGPGSDTAAFARITRDDVMGEPRVRWHSGSHTVELVPVFAKGVGAERFTGLVRGHDLKFAEVYPDWAKSGFGSAYVENIDVFTVMNEVVNR